MAGDENFPIDIGGGGGGGGPRRSDGNRSSGQSGSRGRVPPHNIDAEESVLGAMLLSREAIGVVSEMGLNPADFYRPANRHIFDAIEMLSDEGRERLERYAKGGFSGNPQPGFWTATDLARRSSAEVLDTTP